MMPAVNEVSTLFQIKYFSRVMLCFLRTKKKMPATDMYLLGLDEHEKYV